MSLVCFCGATPSLFSLRATEHAAIPGAGQPCSEGGPRCGCAAVAAPLLFVSRSQTRLWGPLDHALVVRSAHRRPACWARDSGTVRLTSSLKAPIMSAPVHCSRLYTVPCVVLPAQFMPQDASAVSAVPVLCSASSPCSRRSALSFDADDGKTRTGACARCSRPAMRSTCPGGVLLASWSSVLRPDLYSARRSSDAWSSHRCTGHREAPSL